MHAYLPEPGLSGCSLLNSDLEVSRLLDSVVASEGASGVHPTPCRYRAQAFWPPAEIPAVVAALDPAVVLAEAAALPPAPEWSSMQVTSARSWKRSGGCWSSIVS